MCGLPGGGASFKSQLLLPAQPHRQVRTCQAMNSCLASVGRVVWGVVWGVVPGRRPDAQVHASSADGLGLGRSVPTCCDDLRNPACAHLQLANLVLGSTHLTFHYSLVPPPTSLAALSVCREAELDRMRAGKVKPSTRLGGLKRSYTSSFTADAGAAGGGRRGGLGLEPVRRSARHGDKKVRRACVCLGSRLLKVHLGAGRVLWCVLEAGGGRPACSTT